MIRLFVTLLVFSASLARAETFTADVCVYGGTSGGVAAAVQAARMGKSVILLEPGRHLGGMTSGGLSAVDIGDPRSVGGIAREYFTKLAATTGTVLSWDRPFENGGKGGPATGGAYAIEPHKAEAVFDAMVAEAGAMMLREARLVSLEKEGTRIVELVLEKGDSVRAKCFVDTTYEGDLMARAGVSYTLDAACASSLLAVEQAIDQLRNGTSDVALAGAIQLSTPGPVYSGFSLIGALSPSGTLAPFSEGSDGTLLGQGAGMIVLKRLGDAERDGNRIYALIKDVGTSSDGKGAGLLAPLSRGQAKAIRCAMPSP